MRIYQTFSASRFTLIAGLPKDTAELTQGLIKVILNRFYKLCERLAETKSLLGVILEKIGTDPDEAIILNKLVFEFFKYGRKANAYEFLAKIQADYPLHAAFVLSAIAKFEKEIGRCTDKAVILKTLALLKDDDSRATLAHQLKPFVEAYDMVPLVEKAKKIKQLMDARQLNYDQSMAWSKPEIPLLILGTFRRRDNQIISEKAIENINSIEIRQNIASFFGAPSLSRNEWADLTIKQSSNKRTCL